MERKRGSLKTCRQHRARLRVVDVEEEGGGYVENEEGGGVDEGGRPGRMRGSDTMWVQEARDSFQSILTKTRDSVPHGACGVQTQRKE